MINKLNWAIGLLAAYTNAVQIGTMAAEEAHGAEVEVTDAHEEDCTTGNEVNINLEFGVDVKSDPYGYGRHNNDHSSASSSAALAAIANAQAALDAANAELAAMEADDEDTPDVPETKHVHIILDDDFVIDGTPWEDLKDIAMVDGFKETNEFVAYSTEDQAIICAFIPAQTERGLDAKGLWRTLNSSEEITIFYVDEPLAVPEVPPTSHTIKITPDDANIVYFEDQTWADYKATAMKFGWEEDLVIKVLPNFERAVIEAHQQAQFESGSVDGALTGQDPVEITWLDDDSPIDRYIKQTMDVTLNDSTIVNGVAWEELKSTAMGDGYTESEAYTSIDEVDKFIIDELIAQQEPLDAYDSPLADTTVAFTFIYE